MFKDVGLRTYPFFCQATKNKRVRIDHEKMFGIVVCLCEGAFDAICLRRIEMLLWTLWFWTKFAIDFSVILENRTKGAPVDALMDNISNFFRISFGIHFSIRFMICLDFFEYHFEIMIEFYTYAPRRHWSMFFVVLPLRFLMISS